VISLTSVTLITETTNVRADETDMKVVSKVKPGARTTAGLCGVVGAVAVSGRAGAACGRAADGEMTVAGGISYFISCSK